MNYQRKDEIKFSICDKLISRGCHGSSSFWYRLNGVGPITPSMVNTGKYVKYDIVGISVNGLRRDAISFDRDELNKAIKAGATIVKDNKFHTMRPYNTGERAVQEYLLANNYHSIPLSMAKAKIRSVWQPIKA